MLEFLGELWCEAAEPQQPREHKLPNLRGLRAHWVPGGLASRNRVWRNPLFLWGGEGLPQIRNLNSTPQKALVQLDDALTSAAHLYNDEVSVWLRMSCFREKMAALWAQ